MSELKQILQQLNKSTDKNPDRKELILLKYQTMNEMTRCFNWNTNLWNETKSFKFLKCNIVMMFIIQRQELHRLCPAGKNTCILLCMKNLEHNIRNTATSGY